MIRLEIWIENMGIEPVVYIILSTKSKMRGDDLKNVGS